MKVENAGPCSSSLAGTKVQHKHEFAKPNLDAECTVLFVGQSFGQDVNNHDKSDDGDSDDDDKQDRVFHNLPPKYKKRTEPIT